MDEADILKLYCQQIKKFTFLLTESQIHILCVFILLYSTMYKAKTTLSIQRCCSTLHAERHAQIRISLILREKLQLS